MTLGHTPELRILATDGRRRHFATEDLVSTTDFADCQLSRTMPRPRQRRRDPEVAVGRPQADGEHADAGQRYRRQSRQRALASQALQFVGTEMRNGDHEITFSACDAARRSVSTCGLDLQHSAVAAF